MPRSYLALLLLYLPASALAELTDPLTLTPTEDTYFRPEDTGAPASSRPGKDEVQVYGGPDKQQFRALFKFDLSAIKVPPSQALLRVYVYNAGPPKKTELLRCHPIARDWSEQRASWNLCQAEDEWSNPGGDWDPTAAAGFNITTQVSGTKGYWLDFEVTSVVQEWILKRRPNYGLVLLFDPGTTAELRIRSREGGAQTPKLELAWNSKLSREQGMVPGSGMRPYGLPVKMEPAFSTVGLNMVRCGEAFTQRIAARGGAKPYKFTAPDLPEGVSLSTDGTLSGAVAKEGRYAITFSCAGADGKRATLRMELSVQPVTLEVRGEGQGPDKRKDEKPGEAKPGEAKPGKGKEPGRVEDE